MIIAILQQKGGVGKSCITQNLAVALAASNKVLILESDMQGSTSAWFGERELNDMVVMNIPNAAAMRKTISSQADNYDFIIIDGRPYIDEHSALSIFVADLVLLPLEPDVDSIESSSPLVEHILNAQAGGAKVKARYVLNMWPTNPKVNIGKEVVEAIDDDDDMHYCNARLHYRIAYREARKNGLGITESNNKKAAREFRAFTNEVLEVIKWGK